MVIDTSAILAMVYREPERAAYVRLCLAHKQVRLSAAGYVEAAIVIDRCEDMMLTGLFDQMLAEFAISIEPVTAAQARLARKAHRRYGRGSGHPARLNYGDCFAYALSVDTGEPLLFKGNDFVHTDVLVAQ